MTTPKPPAMPSLWWSPSWGVLTEYTIGAGTFYDHTKAALDALRELPADAVRLVPDTVQAPDVAGLPGFLQMQDAIEGALRGAGHDLADMADVVYVATEAVRALLGTDTTPDRLAWISEAGETAAAQRQARYQETACARTPAEETPDA